MSHSPAWCHAHHSLLPRAASAPSAISRVSSLRRSHSLRHISARRPPSRTLHISARRRGCSCWILHSYCFVVLFRLNGLRFTLTAHDTGQPGRGGRLVVQVSDPCGCPTHIILAGMLERRLAGRGSSAGGRDAGGRRCCDRFVFQLRFSSRHTLTHPHCHGKHRENAERTHSGRVTHEHHGGASHSPSCAAAARGPQAAGPPTRGLNMLRPPARRLPRRSHRAPAARASHPRARPRPLIPARGQLCLSSLRPRNTQGLP